MVFRKNLRSLERCWEKISKFLGDLPSEQIFYRNIPLGAPGHSLLPMAWIPEARSAQMIHVSYTLLFPQQRLFT